MPKKTSEYYKKYQISPQVALVTEHNPGARSVVMGLWFPVGSRFETPKQFGAYHFIEHLVFKNPKTLKLVKDIEAVGGDVNAFTSHEHTCFHVTLLKEDYELGLEFLASIVKPLKVPKAEFEKERDVILQEVRSHQDDIEDEVHRFFMAKALKGSGLAHSISGEVENVQELTAKDLQELHRKSYLQGAMVLSVAGFLDFKKIKKSAVQKFKKFNKTAELEKESENYYVDRLRHLPKPLMHAGIYPKDRKTQQVYLVMGFEIDPVFSAERFAAVLFNSWFGQGMASRLYQKVREELGLVYFIHSQVLTFLDKGLFLIEASSEVQKMPEVIDVVFKEIQKLQTSTFSTQRLASQKKILKGQVLLGAEDFENRMQSVALNELLFKKYKSPEDFMSQFAKVKSKDVTSFVRKKLDLNKMSFVLYGPGASEFEPYVKNLVKKYTKRRQK